MIKSRPRSSNDDDDDDDGDKKLILGIDQLGSGLQVPSQLSRFRVGARINHL